MIRDNFSNEASFINLAKCLEKNPPKSDYSLALLSTLKSDHEFFARKYVYEPPKPQEFEYE